MAGVIVNDAQGKVTAKRSFSRFGAVGIALICVQLDYFALALAPPNMAEELNTTATDLQWTVSAYMIAIGVAMIPGSRIADLVGRKKILLIGLAIFGIASLWVGLSPTTGSVIAARVLQGLGAGLYFPVAMSLVSNATHALERPRILGFLSGLAGIGTAAPIIGGGFASTIGWRWVFLINVPIAAIGVIWGARQLKESTDAELAGKSLRHLDWLGVLLIAVGISGVSLGIDDVSTEGISPCDVHSRNPRCGRDHRGGAVGAPCLMAAHSAGTHQEQELHRPCRGVDHRQYGHLRDDLRLHALSPAGAGVLRARCGSDVHPCGRGALDWWPSERTSRVKDRRSTGDDRCDARGRVELGVACLSNNIVVFLIVMAFSSFSLGMGYQFGNIAVQSVVPSPNQVRLRACF